MMMEKIKQHLTANSALWAVYLGLLGVLFPHTAWAFSAFEPPNSIVGSATAGIAAFTFEAAIAVLTHKLAKHIEQAKGSKTWYLRVWRRYGNAYTVGLLVATAVSMLANTAHAARFGQLEAVFNGNEGVFAVYAVAFGTILPLVSILFARVLSNVVDSEQEEDPALTKVKTDLREVKAERKELERQLQDTELRAQAAEARFAALGDFFARLMGESKRERILAVRDRWPQLPASSVVVITESSPAYVSEVWNDGHEHAAVAERAAVE